jgi:hypothetical protein
MVLQSTLGGLSDYRLSERTRLVQALGELRRELQTMEKGKSLLEVVCPVGLILSDIAEKLELSSQERYAFLGGKLCNEMEIVKESLRSELIFD